MAVLLSIIFYSRNFSLPHINDTYHILESYKSDITMEQLKDEYHLEVFPQNLDLPRTSLTFRGAAHQVATQGTVSSTIARMKLSR